MDKLEQSRQEWEEEMREKQHSITPAEGLRAAHLIAKGSSDALIPDFAHLMRLVLGGALLAFGICAFSFRIPHSTALGLALVAAGCCLGFTAFAGVANEDRSDSTGHCF